MCACQCVSTRCSWLPLLWGKIASQLLQEQHYLSQCSSTSRDTEKKVSAVPVSSGPKVLSYRRKLRRGVRLPFTGDAPTTCGSTVSTDSIWNSNATNILPPILLKVTSISDRINAIGGGRIQHNTRSYSASYVCDLANSNKVFYQRQRPLINITLALGHDNNALLKLLARDHLLFIRECVAANTYINVQPRDYLLLVGLLYPGSEKVADCGGNINGI